MRKLPELICVLTISVAAGAALCAEKLPAFPGAEGFGAGATGGRGGKVIRVTNLNAKGPGSLAAACATPGPRIVVFEVSGVIKGDVRLGGPNIYIAGQTAPGAGITLQGRLMSGGSRDAIIRFIRCRPIHGFIGGGNGDCTQLGGVSPMILDHVSVSWGNDENMDFCRCKNLTVQWCAIEESRIGHEKSSLHNYGMIIGYTAGDATLHHNLFAHHSERTPLCGLDTLDHVNNVIYNVMAAIQYHPTRMNRRDKRRYRLNLVGCYFKDGHGGPIGVRPWIQPLNRTFSGISDFSKVNVYGKDIYWSRTGKLHDYNPELEKTHKVGSKFRTDKRWDVPQVTTHKAKEAYELVCAHAGCLPRDAVGKRTVREVRTGTGYWGRVVPPGGLMEGLKPGTPPVDTDKDGMPDEWEKAHKLDPNSPDDAIKTVPAGASEGDRHKGYTYIEYYVNECADKLVEVAIAEAKNRKAPLTAPKRNSSADIKPLDAGEIAIAEKPVAAGAAHSMAQLKGRIWGWGLNWRGELADGTGKDSCAPVVAKDAEDVIFLSSSGAHVMALKKNGSLLGWGYNAHGELGLGTTGDQQLEPAVVKGPDGKDSLTNVVGVSAGGYHSMALRADGTVWTWGSNLEGRLGDGTTKQRLTPVKVKGLTGAIAVAAGNRHSVALRRDGTVCTWGSNLYGELGDGTNMDNPAPAVLSGLKDVAAIAAGWHHTMILKKDGTVWGFGCNHFGQLGDGTELDRNEPVQVKGPDGQEALADVTAIAAGGLHSMALRKDGTLVAWGWNYCSQIGDGTKSWTRSTPVQVRGVKGVGKLKDVLAFDGGGAHSMAMLKDGTVLSWGNNGRGQNGLGWTGSICIHEGKFVDPATFKKQRLHNKGGLTAFGSPWPVKVSAGRPPVEIYAENLTNGAPWLRIRSALSLAGMGPEAIKALPQLIKALEDKDPTVRKHTAWALSKLGPAAKEALPALKKALEDESDSVRSNAKDAIKKIEGK